MRRGERFGSAIGRAASLLAPLAVLEVLALAPARQWLSLSGWSTQALGVAVAVLGIATATAAAAIAGPLRSGARGDDLIVLAVIAVFAGAHLRRPLARWLGAGSSLGLLALVLVVVALFAGLKLLAARRGLSFRQVRPIAIALLALPIGLTAIRRAAAVPADAPDLAATVAGVVAYLLLVVTVSLREGRPRSLLLAGAVVLGLVGLRLLVPNPHEPSVDPAAGVADRLPEQGAGPPVLLIVLDTLRADALDLTAPEISRTPNLARFAREADVYSAAVANASWSLPGHASLFTGLNVSQHRTDQTDEPGFGNRLPASLLTAQEIFARHGYRTSCVVANGLISSATGLARGFQHYLHPGADWIFESFPMKVLSLPVELRHRWAFNQVLLDLTGLRTVAGAREIVDHALRETDGGPRPLYLFLNFMDAHEPYLSRPGEPFLQRAALVRDWALYLLGDDQPAAVIAPYAELFRHRYRVSVERLDRELGRLFETLRRRGWYERMLIVVTADHGQALGDQAGVDSYWGHHSALEAVVRIPLLIKRPGQVRGSAWAHAVQQTDVLPAILAIAGLPPRQGLASRVLAPALDLPVVTEWYPNNRLPSAHSYQRLGLYRDGYKYVVEGDGEREFLYDLELSPYEGADVLAREGRLGAELAAELEAAIRTSRAFGPARTDPEDPAVREQLKALGYVP